MPKYKLFKIPRYVQFAMLMIFMAFSTPILANLSEAMAYSNDTHLYERIDEQTVIELTDDEGTGEVVASIIEARRADATEVIHTYLRGRYDVPVDPAPEILVSIEADLLVDKLFSRRPTYEKPDTIKELKKDAMRQLELISKGTIQLPEQPDVGEAQIVSNKTEENRLFGDDALSSFL